MKSTFWIAIIILGLSTAMVAQTIVTGSIVPGKSYPLELHTYDLQKNTFNKTRDIQLSNEGVFTFEIPADPNLYRLWMPGKGGLDFINDHDTQIEISINMKSSSPFSFQGSPASQQLLEYQNLVGKLQAELLNPLEPLMEKALKDDDKEAIEALEQQHQENLKVFVGQLGAKIDSMGTSLAVYAISIGLDFNKYLEPIESWYRKFEKQKPNSPFTKRFGQLVADAKAVQVGAMAPSLVLQTINESNVSIADLTGSGKVVLVDFWASWCLPCRKENREFKDIIAQYDSGEFIIWSVSIDASQKAWEKAMRKDDMPWLQSRTTDKSVISTFQAVTLPTNFLIDTDGIIRAKNLKARDLQEWLARLLH